MSISKINNLNDLKIEFKKINWINKDLMIQLNG